MKPSCLLILAASAAHAATVATLDVYSGSVAGNPADTFTKLSAGGGAGPNGTRIGLASTANVAREVAGTSKQALWTIPSAGTITLTYFLDNTVGAAFQPGIQGLYDASGGVAATVGGVLASLQAFAGAAGVMATTAPDPVPPSLNSGAGSTGAPAEMFTTTYTIAAGSPVIGKEVAVGFHSAWNGPGGYIFGREAGANQVTLDFVAVPEPAAGSLGLLGAGVLLRRRRH